MDTSAVPLQRLTLSLILALIAVIVLTVLMNDTNARSYALPSPRASASEPPQEPPLCLADVAIVLDVGGSMQEDTRCYGCWEGAGDYPQGITYPLPFGYHCQASDPLAYHGYYYLSIEAEHYSRYPYEADYHWNFTEFPKTWWAMQRQPNRGASGPDVRGAFMMVGPNSPGALYYETLSDIRHPPDLYTTPRLDYDFIVPVSGTYYAWIRAQGGVSYTLNGWAGGRESRRRVHVGLDGVPMATSETPEWGPYNDGADPDNWRWSRMPLTLTLNATGPGDPYTLNVWAAGPGFRLDKIVVTNNPDSGLASKQPLTWDLPGAPDAGPAETHGRTGWACMGPDHPTPDPRFVPVDPQTGQLDDLYDDLQPIRGAKEAFKGMLQAPWSDLDPALDQVGYVVYSATSHIEHELYCLVEPGACADWSPVVEAIEATAAGGLHTDIAEGTWDGLRLLLPGPEPAWNPPDGFPSRVPGQMHYGRAEGSLMLILLTDGIPDRYPKLPPGYGTCYEHDLWPDRPGETLDQRRGRECVAYFAHLARDTGVTIYTIGLGAQTDHELLSHVADVTGGRHFVAPSAEDMEAVLEFISEQVRRNCWPVYGLSKKVMPSLAVTVGQRVTYTLVVTTNLPDLPVTLTDTLPSDTAFISASGDYIPSAPGPGDVLAWPLTPADWIGGVVQRTLVLSVTAVPSDGLLTNTASIAGITASAVLTVGEPEKYRFYLPLVVKGGT